MLRRTIGRRHTLELSKLKEKIEKKWPLDAENGFLSYKKMQYEMNKRHLRIEEYKEFTDSAGKIHRQRKYKSFPLCGDGSHSGWFCSCKSARSSNFAKPLGLGITLYFKTVKQLTLFFLACTILSIPSYCFFWNGDKADNYAKHDAKQFFSLFTLGNLG